MIRVIWLNVLLSTFLACNALAEQYLVDTDFDNSMTHRDTIFLDNMTPQMVKEFEYYKKIYSAKQPSKIPNSDTPIIPKIMHQIWIGGTPLPPLYEHYLKECKLLHPDWEFKLWSDEGIEEFSIKDQNFYSAARF